MPKSFPSLLEYFLEDCLEWDKSFSAKKMFWWYWIYKSWKIFAALFISLGKLYINKSYFSLIVTANLRKVTFKTITSFCCFPIWLLKNIYINYLKIILL